MKRIASAEKVEDELLEKISKCDGVCFWLGFFEGQCENKEEKSHTPT